MTTVPPVAMRITHVSTRDTGGAGMAARRLHEALLAAGVHSDFLVLDRAADSSRVHEFSTGPSSRTRKVALKLGAVAWKVRHSCRVLGLPPPPDAFSFPESPFDVAGHPLVAAADVVHLHWVPSFVDFRTFFSRARAAFVWTIHDCYAFTGGNHCHALFPFQAYRRVLARQEAVTRAGLAQVPSDRMVMVSPSMGHLRASEGSDLTGRFAHVLIPHSIDPRVFRPLEGRSALREKWGIPRGASLVLFVATDADRRLKGFDLVDRAVTAAGIPDLWLGVVGRGHPTPGANRVLFGELRDPAAMNDLYNAADLTISGSLEESFGMSLAESLCAGTPVVTFPVGIAAEVLRPGVDGYLCTYGDPIALKTGLLHWYTARGSFDRSVISARAQELFSPSLQVARYLEVYDRLCAPQEAVRARESGDDRDVAETGRVREAR
jgi:glycosyltransferase involved in cell wall biosynthesis